MKFSKVTINQLDTKLYALKEAYSNTFPKVPLKGWIAMIRNALGISTYVLAKKIGLTQARVVQMEKAEVSQAVTLKTLEKAAEAMDCTLVYAFLPNTSLKNILEEQARKLAKRHLARVTHSMNLEAQHVEATKSQEQLEELVKELLEASLKKLWNEE